MLVHGEGVLMLKTPFEQIVDVNKIGTSHARLNRILSLADDEIVKPSEEDQKKILFLGIDFQNDFMENGALGVPGAHEDVKNVTKFLYHNLHKVTTIAFSLDTHEPIQIFHPSWWVDDNGKYPKPLTIISSDDIESGKWHPIYKVEESKQYVLNLEREGKKSYVFGRIIVLKVHLELHWKASLLTSFIFIPLYVGQMSCRLSKGSILQQKCMVFSALNTVIR